MERPSLIYRTAAFAIAAALATACGGGGGGGGNGGSGGSGGGGGITTTGGLVKAPYFTNDPYFKGFAGTSAPYYEVGSPTSIPGMWDMHAIKLEDAFAFGVSADAPNGYYNPNALGSPSIKVAVIDTGQDTLHPELQSKVVYQKCFITYDSTNPGTDGTQADNFTCPSSDGTQSIASFNGGTEATLRRRGAAKTAGRNQYAPGLIAVSYDTSYAQSDAPTVAARETAVGAQRLSELHFNASGATVHLLAVDPSSVDTAMASLRGEDGVRSVSLVGLRYPLQTSTEYSCGGDTCYQSASDYSTDPQGHGTDVAGIVAAAANNSFGFVGAGGNVSIMAYRVFPTPTSACDNENSDDSSCSATTFDIASAIEDAIDNGVNVINLSLGGGSCNAGVDTDPTEGAAIADAIDRNVIVVAAAGNASANSVDAPACDTGVIAVGASALADGQPNGASNGLGTAAAPVEYVASYSDYGTPGALPKEASAWGIVAPGGDPSSDEDDDDLHWIENIWTSTPYDETAAGTCVGDYPAETGTIDCRTLIAGTSMASPHVAGAAALILSVAPSYQSPTAMKTLLCETADDINDPKEGCGRLNVYRAVAKALGDPVLP